MAAINPQIEIPGYGHLTHWQWLEHHVNKNDFTNKNLLQALRALALDTQNSVLQFLVSKQIDKLDDSALAEYLKSIIAKRKFDEIQLLLIYMQDVTQAKKIAALKPKILNYDATLCASLNSGIDKIQLHKMLNAIKMLQLDVCHNSITAANIDDAWHAIDNLKVNAAMTLRELFDEICTWLVNNPDVDFIFFN